MKTTLFKSYLVIGLGIWLLFGFAAASGWRFPKFTVLQGGIMSGSRSYGGSWGGGK